MTDQEYMDAMHHGMDELNKLCDKYCHVWADLIIFKMSEVEDEIAQRSQEPPDRVFTLVKRR